MRFLSLKARMSFTVVALVFAILAGTGSLALHYFQQSFRQLIADQQATLVEQIADRIDRQIKDARNLIAATAKSFPLEHLKNADLAQAYLDKQLGIGTTTLFDNGIFLFTAEGLLLAEAPFKPDRRGRDYSFRPYFQKTIETGQPQISDPYISSQSHQHPAVNFTAPIHDNEGRIVAVIAGSVDLTHKNFLGGLSDVRIGHTGYLYLYNTERLMIMHRDQQRIMKKDVPLGANIWFDRAIEGFEGTAETVNSRGLRTLVTFKKLNYGRWILAANYPYDEAFQPIVAAQRYFLLGIAAILLLSIIITWVVTRILLAPLARLNTHVAGFFHSGAGNSTNARCHADEIGTLRATFDTLMTEVAEQRKASDDRLTFLQEIIDSIPNPTYYKDLEGRFLGSNQAMQALCGKSGEEMIGATAFDLLSAETAQRIVDGDLMLVQGDISFLKHEINMVPAAGPGFSALIYKALVLDTKGKAQGIVSSLVDISELKAIEAALAGEREFTLNLLQNSAVPCFVIDQDHKVLTWTRAIEELTGLKASEVLGTNQHWRAFYPAERPCLADIVLDLDYDAAIDLYPHLSNSPLIQDGMQSEGWLTLKNGKSHYLTFEAAPITDLDGKVVAVIETLHDLTNLKWAEKALQETQDSYHALVDSSPDAILVHRHGSILFGNRAAVTLFRADETRDLTGRYITELLHPDCHEIALQRIAEVEENQNEQRYIEEKIVCFDGQVLDVEVGSSPTYYAGGVAVQTVLRDITTRKAEQDRVWHQANFDNLTGLPNRSLFMDRLDQMISRCDREGHSAALLFIDLDHFKAVNDTLGHDNGDELLRQVAKRLDACLRKTDTAARLGGDEFTVILPTLISTDALVIVAKRLLAALAEPFELPGGIGRISGSIGGAVYPRDGKCIADLLSVADLSMYQAKQAGRNGYFIPGLE